MTTLAPQTASIVLTANGYNDAWCVYEHHLHHDDGQRSLIMIGACKLTDVYRMIEAQRNSEWLRLTEQRKYVFVNVIATGEKLDCQREAARAATDKRPPCNLRGISITGTRQIACSNGQTYSSQTAAAAALGINQGQLSRHLSGSPAHKTVGGLKFWYDKP